MGVALPYPSKAYLRRRANLGLLDTCQRLVYAASDGDYGPGTVEGYTEGVSMDCLFKPTLKGDVQGETEVPTLDATLYLARTATLDPDDRVTITHLHGDAVASPQTFAIVKGPLLGKTLMEAGLQLITDGSDLEE